MTPSDLARSTGERRSTRLVVSVALSVVLLVGLMAPVADAADPMTIRYANTNRAAVWSDGSDAFTITVKTSGPVKRVIADDKYSLPGGFHAGDEEGRIELYDDGTHGDKTSGDQVFTRSGVSVSAPWDWGMGLWVELRSGAGAVRTWDWPIIGIVVLDPAHEPSITAVDSKLRATDRVANLVVGTDIYKPSPLYSNRQTPDLRAIAKRFYKRYPDRYDFLSIWTEQDVPPGFTHYPVKNTVRGIGQARFDGTRGYGSTGRLLGVNFLGQSGQYALLHETLHQWVAFLDGLGLSRDGHWWAVNVRGYEYGIDFERLAGGRFRITWTPANAGLRQRMPFIELYLAGLAKRSEVPPITRLKGVDPRRVQTGDVVRPTSVKRYSIDRIVRRYGTRKPTYAAARKDFRMATVLVTVNRFATPAEMTMYHLTMENLAGSGPGDANHPTTSYPSWNWATRGRSTMDTRLGAPR